MTTETKLRGVIVLLTLTLLWTVFQWSKADIKITEKQTTINKLTNLTDSLQHLSLIHI